MFCKAKSAKKQTILRRNFRPLPNKNVSIWDHFFPLLLPKDSDSLKILDIRLWEVGAKRRLNGTSKVNTRTNRRTDGQTDLQTDRRTFRLIESIGPEGRCFKNSLRDSLALIWSIWPQSTVQYTSPSSGESAPAQSPRQTPPHWSLLGSSSSSPLSNLPSVFLSHVLGNWPKQTFLGHSGFCFWHNWFNHCSLKKNFCYRNF